MEVEGWCHPDTFVWPVENKRGVMPFLLNIGATGLFLLGELLLTACGVDPSRQAFIMYLFYSRAGKDSCPFLSVTLNGSG